MNIYCLALIAATLVAASLVAVVFAARRSEERARIARRIRDL